MTGAASASEGSIAHLLRHATGLSGQHLDPAERTRRVEAGMRAAGYADRAAYLGFLSRSPSGVLDLASRWTVAETYFFRDVEQLEESVGVHIPRLMAQHSAREDLRIWSAGCASGEEPYSLAILLAERGLLGRAQIVGTDLSEESLCVARRGVFSGWSLRATPEALRRRWFRPAERGFQLAPEIRQRVRFERQNLLEPGATPPWGRADLIVCRNVLIYFTPSACRRASLNLAHGLAPHGTLMAGSSDPFADLPDLWTKEVRPSGVFYHRLAAGRPLLSRALPGSSEDVCPRPFSPPVRAPEPGARAVRPNAAERSAFDAGPRSADDALEALQEIQKHAGVERAIAHCRALLERDALAVRLHLWLVALLLELRRDEEAERSLRAILYLEPEGVMGLWLAALWWKRRGDAERAMHAYGRVAALCAGVPEDVPVPYGSGVSHGELLTAARAEAEAASPSKGAT